MAGRSKPHSAGEGKGSTFTVRLPIRAVRIGRGPRRRGDGEQRASVSPRMRPTIAARFPLVRLDGLRVLVVDDEADARRVLVMVLEQVGAIVTAAASAAQAMEALPEARPDVLVSDLGMPDQDGFDLIRQCATMGMTRRICPPSRSPRSSRRRTRAWRCWLGFKSMCPSPSTRTT